jgi:vanillate O-demethylase ferredoxin subunit
VKSDADARFEVRLASSGRTITIAADKTVVQALAEAGVEIPTSCEQGVCGTCLTRVLDGTPDHRDQYLTPEEQAANDQFTPCCSRSKSPLLVLDL